MSRWAAGPVAGHPDLARLIRSSIDALSCHHRAHGADEFVAEISRRILADLSPDEWAALRHACRFARRRTHPPGGGPAGAESQRVVYLADPMTSLCTIAHCALRPGSEENARAQSLLEGDLVRRSRPASVSDEHIKGLFKSLLV